MWSSTGVSSILKRGHRVLWTWLNVLLEAGWSLRLEWPFGYRDNPGEEWTRKWQRGPVEIEFRRRKNWARKTWGHGWIKERNREVGLRPTREEEGIDLWVGRREITSGSFWLLDLIIKVHLLGQRTGRLMFKRWRRGFHETVELLLVVAVTKSTTCPSISLSLPIGSGRRQASVCRRGNAAPEGSYWGKKCSMQ